MHRKGEGSQQRREISNKEGNKKGKEEV